MKIRNKSERASFIPLGNIPSIDRWEQSSLPSAEFSETQKENEQNKHGQIKSDLHVPHVSGFDGLKTMANLRHYKLIQTPFVDGIFSEEYTNAAKDEFQAPVL